jgi:hypothetical protein
VGRRGRGGRGEFEEGAAGGTLWRVDSFARHAAAVAGLFAHTARSAAELLLVTMSTFKVKITDRTHPFSAPTDRCVRCRRLPEDDALAPSKARPSAVQIHICPPITPCPSRDRSARGPCRRLFRAAPRPSRRSRTTETAPRESPKPTTYGLISPPSPPAPNW